MHTQLLPSGSLGPAVGTGLSAPLLRGVVTVAADAKAVTVPPSLFWYLGLLHGIDSSKALLQRCLDEEAKEAASRGKLQEPWHSDDLTTTARRQRSVQQIPISLFLGKREVGVCFSGRNIFSSENT